MKERDMTKSDLFKEAIIKIDAFISDVSELREFDMDSEDRETLTQMAEYAGIMEATLVNMLRKEMGDDESEFISEAFDIDVSYDTFPEYLRENKDILDLPLEKED